MLTRLLLLCVWLSALGCGDGTTEPSAYSETKIIPTGQTYAVTLPSTTTMVDILVVGPGGQANVFAAGSGGGYVKIRGLPLKKGDDFVVFAAKANSTGTAGWIRANNSVVRTRYGFLIAESGTSYYDPGYSLYDPDYAPYVESAGAGQPAVGETVGCGFEAFGCGGWANRDAMDGYIKLHFYTR